MVFFGRTVAVVDTTGLVTAVSPGECTITVTTVDGGFMAYCTISASTTPIQVNSVSITPASVTDLGIGDTSQLTPVISPVNATNQSVSWNSSNPVVATVNSAGLVTATGGGSATITVTTADGGKSGTCAVTVPVYSVSFNSNGGTGSMSTLNIAHKQTVTLSACTFTKSGYTFDGWALSSAGPKVYNNNAGFTHKTKTNVELWAVWIPVPFAVQNTICTGYQGSTFGVGDLNNDGINDVICYISSATGVKTYIQNPDGTFTETQTLDTNSQELYGADIADLQNDGYPDLFLQVPMAHPPVITRYT
jgi:uncharacterized repeat protein (TIGR02543 family)